MPSGAEEAAAAARAQKKQGQHSTGRIKVTDLIGGYLASKFSKEKGMAKYSKLIAAIGGNLLGAGVALLLGWLATKGFATCAPDPTDAGEQICSIAVLGSTYTQSTITAWLMGLIMTYVNGQLVYSAPANTK